MAETVMVELTREEAEKIARILAVWLGRGNRYSAKLSAALDTLEEKG